jgi:hypothetical protein
MVQVVNQETVRLGYGSKSHSRCDAGEKEKKTHKNYLAERIFYLFHVDSGEMSRVNAATHSFAQSHRSDNITSNLAAVIIRYDAAPFRRVLMITLTRKKLRCCSEAESSFHNSDRSWTTLSEVVR